MKEEEKIILIIEDDTNLNELMSERVSESGFMSQSFTSGKEALSWLKSHVPLMMFIDFSLPDFTGKEFILELKKQYIQVPPFAVATGRGDEMIAVEMMKLGARDYFIKDINFLDRVEIITKQLSKDIENENKLIEIENKLKESNEFNKQIIESAKEGVIVYDKQLNCIVWNPFMESLTGLSHTKTLGKNINDFFTDTLRNKLVRNLKNSLNGNINELEELEFYFDFPETGKSGWVVDVTSPLKNSVGEIIGSISIIRNISERKKSENALRESENKYRKLIENSPDAIAIHIDGIITMVNNECLRLMKANSSDQLIGMKALDFVHPNYKEFVIHRMKVSSKKTTFTEEAEEVFVRLDGSIVEVEVKAMPVQIDEKTAIQLVIRDITERKAAKNYLIESKTALQNLIYSSTELIESTSSVIDYAKFTDNIRKISGAKYAAFNLFEPDGLRYKTIVFSGLSNFSSLSKKFLGYNFYDKIWKDDPIKQERIRNATVSKFESLLDLLDYLMPKTIISLLQQTFNLGAAYVVRISQNNVLKGDFTLMFETEKTLQNPEIVELYANQIGLFLDRYLAEKNLKESETKYRMLFADSPQPMFIYDIETTKFLEVNQSAIKHYGYSRAEFLSMSILDIHLKENLQSNFSGINNTKIGINTDGTHTQLKKNGERIIVETTAVASPTFGKNARHIIINDITLRKNTEEKLKSSNSLLNATLESTADGIWVVNNNNDDITLYNSRFIELWGISKELLELKQKKPFLEYISNLIINPEEYKNETKKIFSQPDKESRDIIELKDGRTFERVSLPQYIKDKIVGRVLSIRDITEQIKAEKEIQQRVDEMTRFHNLTIGRELTMIELKKEINKLCLDLGKKEKYRIVE